MISVTGRFRIPLELWRRLDVHPSKPGSYIFCTRSIHCQPPRDQCVWIKPPDCRGLYRDWIPAGHKIPCRTIKWTGPLTVQFTDLSTGSPKSWEWSFGDGTQSSEKNPVHIFQYAGVYNVTLRVTNAYGTDKYSQEAGINVTAPTKMDVYLAGSINGALIPDGYVRLRVTDPASSMKIAGKIFTFEPGDMIQLIYGPGSMDGTISTDKNRFTAFNFNDITLVKNGETLARGPVNSFSLGGFDSYASTLNLTIPRGDPYSTLYINSEPYKYVESPKFTFSGIGPDSAGRFFIRNQPRL